MAGTNKISPSSGTGNSSSLSFSSTNIGKNTTRAQRTLTFNLAGTNESVSGSNFLQIVQAYAALSNTSSSTSGSVYATNSVQLVTFTGIANGKYLRYSNVSNGITVSSATENSSGSNTAFGSSYTQVANFVGGTSTYNYTLIIAVPERAAGGSYSVTVDTADTQSGTVKESVVYTVQVNKTSMVINGDDAVANTDNTAQYTITYSPEGTPQTGCTWAVSPEGYATISSSGVLTITNTSTQNQQLTITATNSYDSSVTASKVITATYQSTPAGNPFDLSTNSVSVIASETNDYTPEITLRTAPAVSISDLSITNRSGILASAAINSKTKKIFTTFTANDTSSSRSGSLTVYYNSGGEEYSEVVSYTQSAKPANVDDSEMNITAFTITENNGTLTANVTVEYKNNGTSSYTFHPSGVIEAYDNDNGPSDPTCNTLFERVINTSLSDCTVAASDGETWVTETRSYTHSWTPTYPSGTSWSDVLRAKLRMVDSSRHTAYKFYIKLSGGDDPLA